MFHYRKGSSPVLNCSRIEQITKPRAERFLRVHEHFGNVGLGVWHWGLFIGRQLAAVVSYGTVCFSTRRGWLASLSTQVGYPIIQLCRGGSAKRAPVGAASRLVCGANRAMSRLKGPVFVVAYADPKLGEVGTIYQACNAVYTGFTRPKGQAQYVIFGRRMSAWEVRKRFGTRDRSKLRELDPVCTILTLEPKHRYVMVAGHPLARRNMVRQLQAYRLPYPKRHDA